MSRERLQRLLDEGNCDNQSCNSCPGYDPLSFDGVLCPRKRQDGTFPCSKNGGFDAEGISDLKRRLLDTVYEKSEKIQVSEKLAQIDALKKEIAEIQPSRYPYYGKNTATIVYFTAPNTGIALRVPKGTNDRVGDCHDRWKEVAFHRVELLTRKSVGE